MRCSSKTSNSKPRTLFTMKVGAVTRTTQRRRKSSTTTLRIRATLQGMATMARLPHQQKKPRRRRKRRIKRKQRRKHHRNKNLRVRKLIRDTDKVLPRRYLSQKEDRVPTQVAPRKRLSMLMSTKTKIPTPVMSRTISRIQRVTVSLRTRLALTRQTLTPTSLSRSSRNRTRIR